MSVLEKENKNVYMTKSPLPNSEDEDALSELTDRLSHLALSYSRKSSLLGCTNNAGAEEATLGSVP